MLTGSQPKRLRRFNPFWFRYVATPPGAGVRLPYLPLRKRLQDLRVLELLAFGLLVIGLLVMTYTHYFDVPDAPENCLACQKPLTEKQMEDGYYCNENCVLLQ